jgi:hypothetical protein
MNIITTNDGLQPLLNQTGMQSFPIPKRDYGATLLNRMVTVISPAFIVRSEVVRVNGNRVLVRRIGR